MPARGAIGDPPHLRRAGSDALRRNGDDAINALQCGAMPGVRELKQHRRRIKSADKKRGWERAVNVTFARVFA